MFISEVRRKKTSRERFSNLSALEVDIDSTSFFMSLYEMFGLERFARKHDVHKKIMQLFKPVIGALRERINVVCGYKLRNLMPDALRPYGAVNISIDASTTHIDIRTMLRTSIVKKLKEQGWPADVCDAIGDSIDNDSVIDGLCGDLIVTRDMCVDFAENFAKVHDIEAAAKEGRVIATAFDQELAKRSGVEDHDQKPSTLIVTCTDAKPDVLLVHVGNVVREVADIGSLVALTSRMYATYVDWRPDEWAAERFELPADEYDTNDFVEHLARDSVFVRTPSVIKFRELDEQVARDIDSSIRRAHAHADNSDMYFQTDKLHVSDVIIDFVADSTYVVYSLYGMHVAELNHANDVVAYDQWYAMKNARAPLLKATFKNMTPKVLSLLGNLIE